MRFASRNRIVRASNNALGAMPVLIAVAVLLALVPSASSACSCMGTGSIGSALTHSDAVIVGRLLRRAAGDYSHASFAPDALIFEIERTLKGDVSGPIYVPASAPCYRSFRTEDFNVGETYVLPLYPVETAGPENINEVSLEPDSRTEPIGRWFNLPGCSHSALGLVDGALYTRELTSGGGRRSAYYMSLAIMEALLPLGLLDPLIALLYAIAASVLGVVLVVLRKRNRKRRHGV
jgi:hypothetical protein